jgi:hypothetical protein
MLQVLYILCVGFIISLLSCFRDSEESVLPSLAALDDDSPVRQTLTSMATTREEAEEDQINQPIFTGSSSHYFLEPCPYHHNQFELATSLQMQNEIILLMVSR